MARNFYEDDEVVITKPGYNTAITKELKQQESSHGDISFVEGMTVRSTPYLETQLNKFRLYAHDKLSIIESEVSTQISAASNELTNLNQSVQSLIKEPVLPNMIYILTFTLSGSIISSNRSLPIRFLTPSLFGLVAYNYYMPKSAEYAKTQLLDYEASKFPNFYQSQSKLLRQINEQNNQLNSSINSLNKDLQDKIHDARIYLNDLLK